MHPTRQIAVLTLVLTAALSAARAQAPARIQLTSDFEQEWRFIREDVPDAQRPELDDSTWRTVRLPHDWSIEGPFDRNNPTGRGGAYLPAGIGWYRKSFRLPADLKDRRVYVRFDGIMANSEVWINGVSVGKRPFGYVSLTYDLTEHVRFDDAPNVLAVRADNSIQPASRWYTGAGIYRRARLILVNPVHIAPWGVFVSTPQVRSDKAVIKIQTTVLNQSGRDREITLQSRVFDPHGREVVLARSTQFLPAGGSLEFQQQAEAADPVLWNIESPRLYCVESTLLENGKILDDGCSTPFGIRTFEFKADSGFWLNGKNIKIKGVCLHHDGGALGAAVPAGVWRRRLEQFKKIGVNAVRTAHNPVSPEFLDLCDELGFLVMHEVLDTWTAAKNHAEKGYNLYFSEWWQRDVSDAVLRDRNHPSIILYSAGNEIRDNLNSEKGFEQFKALRDLYRRIDPTRPVTMALFRPNQSRVYDNGFAELMDVVGQNYRVDELLAAHRQKPERKILSTENVFDRESWLALRDHLFYAGQFLWTGIDYLGEADWPKIAWTEALLDRTELWRPRAFERQSWWSSEPMVHIARFESITGAGGAHAAAGELCSNWTPRDFDAYDEAVVEVYSNCDEVELFLNGQSKGVKPLPADASPRVWKMYFEKGTIRAEGRNSGKTVAVHEMQTTGPAAALRLTADRTKLTPDWDDVSYVTVTVTDEKGVPCPWADNLVTFEIFGPGVIAAVDNGDPMSHEPFRGNHRQAYRGRCIAVIRATAPGGTIRVKASAEGLKSGAVTIETAAEK